MLDTRSLLTLNGFLILWILAANLASGLCPGGFTQFGSSCYGIDPYSILTWNGSESRCQRFGGHLVSLHSQREIDFLQYFVSNQRASSRNTLSDGLWVGLHHHNPLQWQGQARFAYRQGWQWSDGTAYDQRDTWYDSLWALGAPIAGQNCAIIGLSGTKLVGRVDGGEGNHGICRVPATCPTAFYQMGNNCYMINKEKEETRRQYQDYCDLMGGHLVSITSAEELKFLERKIKVIFPLSYSVESFWMGLHNPSPIQIGGQPTSVRRTGWGWSDGSAYNTSMDVLWDWSEPNEGERHTYMKNFIWFGTRDVENRSKGICKANVERVAVYKPTTTTTTTRATTKVRPTTMTTMKRTTTTAKLSTTATTTTTSPTIFLWPVRRTRMPPIALTPEVTTEATTTTTTTRSTTTTATRSTMARRLPPVTLNPLPPITPYPLPPVTLRPLPTTFKPMADTSTVAYGIRPRPVITSTVAYPSNNEPNNITSTVGYPSNNEPNNNDSNKPDNNNKRNDNDDKANDNENTFTFNRDQNGVNSDRNDTKSVQSSSLGSQGFSKYAPAFVAAPVFVLFIIMIIILVRRGYICSGSSSGGRVRSLEERDTAIQVDNLGFYLSYPGLSTVEKEYKSIPGTFEYPTHIARWQPTKNTFKNYVPYDNNRVTLEQRDGDPNTDYINASFIEGYNSSNKTYIAAQGPRENTVVDFWRMIWEHGVSVVIMLTSPAESGKGKCLVYWPLEEGETSKYGEVKVTLDQQSVYADDTVRVFFIKNGNQSRRMTQLYFHAWPDSGAPTYPVTLLNFWRKVKKHMISSRSPVLIHCSSGAGRTGTFIALDFLLEQAAAEGQVDIYSCVTKLRQQRPWMVATQREYKCIYHAVQEGVTTGSTSIAQSEFYNTFRLLTNNQHEAGGATSLQQQFKTIKNIEAELKLLGKIDTVRALMKGIGKYSKKQSKEPDVNFHRLDGFNKPKAFILTSAPLVTKIDTFWSTVYERKCKVVVMLCPRENISFIQTYFPDAEEATFSAPPFTVECLSVREDGSQVPMIAKEMKIEARGKPRHNFCHMSVKSDLSRLPVPSQAAILVFLRNKAQRRCHDAKTNTRFPMLVHCLNGTDWSGVFYALCYLLDQLDSEREVDVFQAVRQVRHLHQPLIQTEEQYILLYEAVAYYIHKMRPDQYSC